MRAVLLASGALSWLLPPLICGRMSPPRPCCELPPPPTRPLPKAGAPAREIGEYNEEAAAIFKAHAKQCYWCSKVSMPMGMGGGMPMGAGMGGGMPMGGMPQPGMGGGMGWEGDGTGGWGRSYACA